MSYQRRTSQRFNWPGRLNSVLLERHLTQRWIVWVGVLLTAGRVVSVAELEVCDKRKRADIMSVDVRTIREARVSHLVTLCQSLPPELLHLFRPCMDPLGFGSMVDVDSYPELWTMNVWGRVNSLLRVVSWVCSVDCLATLLASGWQPPLPQDGLGEGVHRHCRMSL